MPILFSAEHSGLNTVLNTALLEATPMWSELPSRWTLFLSQLVKGSGDCWYQWCSLTFPQTQHAHLYLIITSEVWTWIFFLLIFQGRVIHWGLVHVPSPSKKPPGCSKIYLISHSCFPGLTSDAIQWCPVLGLPVLCHITLTSCRGL